MPAIRAGAVEGVRCTERDMHGSCVGRAGDAWEARGRCVGGAWEMRGRRVGDAWEVHVPSTMRSAMMSLNGTISC